MTNRGIKSIKKITLNFYGGKKVQFYTKDEAGNFNEATNEQIESLFQERSEKIVAKKLSAARERETARIKSELQAEITKEVSEKIKAETTAELETGFKEKLDALSREKTEAETKLRRKTIAAEYGFKTDAEEFLGDGTEEEMRAKADALKTSFATPGNEGGSFPEKKSADQPLTGEFVTLYGTDNNN